MSEQNIKMSENESLLAHCKEENIKLTKDLEMISQNNTKLQDSLDEMQEDKKQFFASIPGNVSEDKIKSNEELLDQIDALKHDVQNYKSNSEEKDREIKELKKDVKTKHEKIVTLENEERLRTSEAVSQLIDQLKMKDQQLESLHHDLNSTKDCLEQVKMKAPNDGKSEVKHAELNVEELHRSLRQTEIELELKESLFKDALQKFEFSENKLKKMDKFLQSQKERISSLETTFEENEQEKALLQKRIIKLESDDTFKSVIEELNLQHEEDIK